MDWSDQLTRIRRWVRDPDSNIFTDAFLLRLFNDELNSLHNQMGVVADVKVIRTHPEFQSAYLFDWEWAHNDNASGEVYQAGDYYDAGDEVYQHIWEPESLKGYNATTSCAGTFYTQPWEAWVADTPYFPPPIPMPSDFGEMVFIAYDKDEITPESKSELLSRDDQTWKTRTGEPLTYWRDEQNSNWIFIYPLPTVEWQDSYDAETDPEEAEYATGTPLPMEENILAVFRSQANEIEDDNDESTLPSFLHKYAEYGTAARALRANTDGQILSLADYWDMRKKAGQEVIKRYKTQKMAGRNFCFKPQNGGRPSRQRRHPRLPSEYPDNWT